MTEEQAPGTGEIKKWMRRIRSEMIKERRPRERGRDGDQVVEEEEEEEEDGKNGEDEGKVDGLAEKEQDEDGGRNTAEARGIDMAEIRLENNRVP